MGVYGTMGGHATVWHHKGRDMRVYGTMTGRAIRVYDIMMGRDMEVIGTMMWRTNRNHHCYYIYLMGYANQKGGLPYG